MSTDKALQDAKRGELDLVHSRVVAAPRERVYGAFTDHEKLSRWWGPAGFTCRTARIELRVGGEWHVTLVGPDRTEYPNVYRFVELVKDERMVLDHVIGHWFQLTATLEDAAGGTRVTWRQTFPTRAERDGMAEICVPANEENLDKLEALLAGERG